MRKYEGMRLPPGVDKALRKELLKPDRWLKQAQAALAKSLTKTNYPTAIVTVGSPGVPGSPGNFPAHKHSGALDGGPILGTTASTINAYGLWDFNNGLGVGAVQTTRLNVNIQKTFDNSVLNGDFKGLNVVTTVSNFGVLNSGSSNIFAPHFIKLETTLTDPTLAPNETRGLFVNLKISNTSDDNAAVWTNTSYLTAYNTNKQLGQLIGNRVSVQASSASGFSKGGDLTKFEAYAMDNSWALDTAKTITEFTVFSCPNHKVTGGNGITNLHAIKVDAWSGGTVATSYILKADAPAGGVTTSWGLHISGSDVKNYLQGKVGINQSAPSAAQLEVDSSAAGTNAILAKAAASASVNIVEVQDSSANVLGGWDKDGIVKGTLGGSIRNKSAGLVLASVDLTGQTASISATTLVAPVAGFYQVSLYSSCTTLGSAGDSVSFSITWNDGTNAQSYPIVDPLVGASMGLDSTGNAFQGTVVFYAAAGTDIKYSSTVTKAGSPQYMLHIRLEGLY